MYVSLRMYLFTHVSQIYVSLHDISHTQTHTPHTRIPPLHDVSFLWAKYVNELCHTNKWAKYTYLFTISNELLSRHIVSVSQICVSLHDLSFLLVRSRFFLHLETNERPKTNRCWPFSLLLAICAPVHLRSLYLYLHIYMYCMYITHHPMYTNTE